MKIYRKSLCISLLFVLIGLSFLFFSNNVQGVNSTLDFTFEKDLLYENIGIQPLNETFNVRNQSIYTNIYNGTYSFTNDTDGSYPTDWSVNEAGGTVKVVNSKNGHNKVLELNDTHTTLSTTAINTLDSVKTSGTIELWFLNTDCNQIGYVKLRDSEDVEAIYLRTSGDQWYLFDGAIPYQFGTPLDNTWYHIKIEFDCGTNKWNLWINTEYIGEYDFRNAVISIENLLFATHTADSGDYTLYYDGVGYSWDFYYNIEDNIFPYIQTNNSLEVNKYEFALKNINDFYDIGNLNPSTWDTYTQGTGVSQIGGGLEPTKDRVVFMFGTGVGNNFGIKKTNFDYTEKFIDINFGLYFVDWSGSDSFIMIEIDSSDGTSIVALAFYNDGRFAYIDDGVQILRTDIEKEINYDIGLRINYELDKCFLYYSVEDVLIEIYVINLLATGKKGLREIDISSILSGSEFTMLGLDYVGVYANGSSDAGEAEYGYLTIDLKSPSINWNFERNNYFSIIASGKFAIYACEGIYLVEETVGLVFEEIKYNNTEILFNIYERGFTDLDNPFLIVYLSDNIFNNITYLNIEGIKLLEGLNEYFPSYAYEGINANKSYFWVDSNNRLQFSLTVDDDNLEYLQLIFNVNDVSSEDRSISFTSDINGDSKGYFSLDYTDTTSSILEFPYYQTSTKVILPQTKTIDKFTILITDNDLDDNDLCSGYISDIQLIYNPDVAISIIISTLTQMIIPLIVMILPAIIMGKKFGIVGVIATFILMSLVCVIANLIPIWMFFIIIFGSITLLFLKQRGVIK